jgi:hypothetical protein
MVFLPAAAFFHPAALASLDSFWLKILDSFWLKIK